jgi:predicted transcriptional regulator with HTH domain
MPRLSNKKLEKIQEQILFYLYSIFPKQIFTVDIAREIARDEEFTKKMLLDLEKKGLLVKIDKNEEGIKYEKRLRWRISNSAYEIYNSHQKNMQQSSSIIEKESITEQ